MLEHARKSLEKTQPELKRVTIAGDFRRGCELVVDLALVAEAPRSDGEPTAHNSSGLKIHLTDRKHFGAALLQATGSSDHIDQLRNLAARKGMRLEGDGLHKDRSLVAGTEDDIYRALDLPFIEQKALREIGAGDPAALKLNDLKRLVQSPVKIYNCPSRRPASRQRA